MAKLTTSGVDDLIKQLNLLDIDVIAPKMIDESLPILESATRSAASSHRVSGDMLASIKKGKAKKNQYGFYGEVRPIGVDSKGVSNNLKAIILEYGSSRQRATPFITGAVASSEPAVLAKMQEVFDREGKT